MAKIVIVDDSETVRSQLKQALEAAGHTVIEGVNGNDGYDKIIEVGKPDLVISDYNMPGADGLSMLTKVKDKLGLGVFPIFMLTTETSDNLKSAGKLIGITAWINKPFESAKLVAGVAKVLASRK
jgi:two-component system chemotaxis response regulator CheY